MNLLASIAHVAFSGYIALRFVRWYRQPPPSNRIAALLAGLLMFATVFWGGFLVPGFLGLVTGWPLVLPVLAASLTGVSAFTVWMLGRSRVVESLEAAEPQPVRRLFGELDGAARSVVVAGIGTFLVLAMMLSAGFPRGYEPRAYHLPIAIHVFQARSLDLWDSEYMDTFPANASIYYGFLLGFLPERAVSASNFLFLGLLVVALYGLSRATGSDPSASLIAAFGAATVPIVAFSALETGADLGGVAFLGVAVYFALVPDPPRDRDAALAGLASGLAFGFKSLHLVSVGFLLLAIALRRGAATTRQGVNERLKFAVVGLLLFPIGVLAMAGVWLVRNAMQLGNPIYPVHLGAISNAMGWTRAPDIDYLGRGTTQFEWVRSPREWFLYPWIEWHAHNENFKHSSGLGAYFAAMVPPAFLTSCAALLMRPRGVSLPAFFVSGAIALSTAWWLLVDRQPRYLMGALVYLLPLVGWILGRCSGFSRRVLGVLAASTAILMFGVVLSKEGVEFWSRVAHHRQWRRNEFYAYPPAVDRLPEGATVVNLGERPQNFELFGLHHDNRVVNSQRALRAFGVTPRGGEVPPSLRLDAGSLRRLRATHLCASSDTELRTDPEVNLSEAGRSQDGPHHWRILYRVEYPGAPKADPGVRQAR